MAPAPIAMSDYFAEHTAGCRNEEDGADGLHRLVGDMVEILHLAGHTQQVNGKQQADRQSDDWCAEELDAGCNRPLHAGHGSDGAQGHEQDRDYDGRKGRGCTGQLPKTLDEFIIISFICVIFFAALGYRDVLFRDVEGEEVDGQECVD